MASEIEESSGRGVGVRSNSDCHGKDGRGRKSRNNTGSDGYRRSDKEGGRKEGVQIQLG